MYGYQPSGAARTLFLFGIAVGAVTSLALRLLLTNLWPSASRAADARRAVARRDHETAFINQDRDAKLEHQQRADTATTSDKALTQALRI